LYVEIKVKYVLNSHGFIGFNFGKVFMIAFRKGWGIQIMEDFAASSFVFQFVGEIVANAKLAYCSKVYEDCKRLAYNMVLDVDESWRTYLMMKGLYVWMELCTTIFLDF
jgi:hypothetical protein